MISSTPNKSKLLFILGALSLAIYLGDRSGVFTLPKTLLFNLTTPLRIIGVSFERGLEKNLAVVTQAAKLAENNRNLNLENAKLKGEVEKLKDLENKNKILEEQLKVSPFLNQLVEALVVGEDADSKDLLIKTSQPVQEGMIVVLGNNYLGRLTKVESNLARVQRVTSTASQIPVITALGSRAVATGSLGNQIVIQLLNEDKVAKGELIKTSGQSGINKDLIVGEVMEIKEDQKNLFKQVILKTLIDPTNADVVFVIKN